MKWVRGHQYYLALAVIVTYFESLDWRFFLFFNTAEWAGFLCTLESSADHFKNISELDNSDYSLAYQYKYPAPLVICPRAWHGIVPSRSCGLFQMLTSCLCPLSSSLDQHQISYKLPVSIQ